MDNNVGLMDSKQVSTDKISAYLWGVFGICFLANAIGGTVSTLMSVYLPVIVATLSDPLDESQLNQVSAFINALYLLGWAIGGITWGFIGDKIGRSKSLALCICWVGFWTASIFFTNSWELVVGLRFLAGFGVGGVMVITMTLLSEIWPISSRSIIMGIVSIGFPVGIFSSGLINYVVSDWKQAFLVGLLPLLLSVISFYYLKESKEWKSSTENSQTPLAKVPLLKIPSILVGSVIFGTMVIGLWSAFSWIPTWVQSLLTTSDGQSERGIVMMLLGGAGITGGFFSGWIVKLIGVKKSMLLCFIGCLVSSTIMYGFFHTFSPLVYMLTGILAFFFGMSQGLLSFFIPQLFPVPVRAFATGFCFNAGRIVTAVAVFTLGSLVSFFGTYGNALLAFTLVFLIGLVSVTFTKFETSSK